MKPTIHFIVVTALRDRLFVSILGLLGLTFAIAAYLGGGAVIETQAMTVVYIGGAARVILALGLIVFTAFHVERLYDTREIEAILSRAISREAFVFSYWLAMALIALLFLTPVAATIFFFGLSQPGALYWSASVFLESLIIVAFGLFCALTFERAIPTIFATMGFYALARLVGFLTGIAVHGSQAGLNSVANPIMEGIGYVAPRLDLVGQTRWLVYGPESFDVFVLIGLQAAIYVPLLLCASMFDLRRKHF